MQETGDPAQFLAQADQRRIGGSGGFGNAGNTVAQDTAGVVQDVLRQFLLRFGKAVLVFLQQGNGVHNESPPDSKLRERFGKKSTYLFP